MKLKMLIGTVVAVALGGCTGGLLDDDLLGAVAASERNRQNGKEAGRIAEQMRREAIAKGAMDPLDRAEVEIYRAYQDAKYPLTKKDDDKGDPASPKQR